MALFDFLKRKKQIEKAKEVRKEKPATIPAKQDLGGRPSRKPGGFSFEVVKQPHISEKATDLAEWGNQYVFEVFGGPSGSYNKKEVKKTIEGIYGVDVLSVNFIKIPAKKRRLGGVEGFRKAYKKAIVKIKEGQKIEIL